MASGLDGTLYPAHGRRNNPLSPHQALDDLLLMVQFIGGDWISSAMRLRPETQVTHTQAPACQAKPDQQWDRWPPSHCRGGAIEHELSSLFFQSPQPWPRKVRSRERRRMGCPSGRPCPLPTPGGEGGWSQNRPRPHPRLQALQPLVWHELWVGDGFESEIKKKIDWTVF